MSDIFPGSKIHLVLSDVTIDATVKTAIVTPPWYLSGNAPMPDVVYEFPDGTDYAASMKNVINPGAYDAIAGVDPLWGKGVGITFDGVTQWLDTQYTPGVECTVLARLGAVNTSLNRAIMGVYTYPSFRIMARTSTHAWWHVGDGDAEGIDPIGNCTLAMSKKLNILTGLFGYGYQDGLPVTDLPANVNDASLHSIYLGASNTGGAPTGFCAVNIKYFALWPSNLTDAMIAAVHAAVMLK